MEQMHKISPTFLRHLRDAPQDRPVLILLRHSVRAALPPEQVGNDLPLTDLGRELAVDLGGILGDRLQKIYTSPVLRCVQTAELLLYGALKVRQAQPMQSAQPTQDNIPILPIPTSSIQHDRRLGDPGVYIRDAQTAWQVWLSLGIENTILRLCNTNEALDGMYAPQDAARTLVSWMEHETSGAPNGYYCFVTHDSILMPTTAHTTGRRMTQDDWPQYLEGALFWLSDPSSTNMPWVVLYRDMCTFVQDT